MERVRKKFNILVFYYSQTGRTKEILDIFLEPLKFQQNINLEIVKIEPQKPFPFPWPKVYFFSIMPETVYETSIPLKKLKFNEDIKYDLIIIGCQVWFLAPSLPISSLLQHPKSKVFSNTPVVTILTCRKMWFQALQNIEKRINKLNSRMIDKVIVCVEGSQMKTLRGTKDNLFRPNKNGHAFGGNKTWKVDKKELELIKRMGNQLVESLDRLKSKPISPIFKEGSTALKNPAFLYPEKITKNSFLHWGRFIKRYSKPKSNSRYFFTTIFAGFFLFKIIIGAPIFQLFYKVKSIGGSE